MRASGTALALMLAYGIVGAGMKDPFVAFAADSPERLPAAAEPAHGRTASDPAGAIERNGNPLWAVPLSSLSATRDRPMFSPSRRPPAPPSILTSAPQPSKPVTPPREAEHPPLALLGTIVSESLQIAIFFEEKTKMTTRLKTGEDYDGWVLRSVATREVEFKGPHRNAVLALPSPKAATTANPDPVTDPVAPAQHRRR
jgi:hypothetical protein